jgi:hypothetical protein
MIWLSWRQFRVQALAISAVLLVFVAALALTWTQVTDLARESGFTGCRPDACGEAAGDFLRALDTSAAGLVDSVATVLLLVLLPVLLGIFWGAPLVARELETGTYRMVLSQSVGRRRWLLVKLAVGGGAAALGAGLTGLVLTWWAAPIDQAGNRVEPVVLVARGIVPIGSAVLAFVVGVTAGLVLRRTLVAMAVTLLVVGALQVVATPVLVGLLAQPVTSVAPLDLDGRFLLATNPVTGQVHVDVPVSMPGAHVLRSTTVTPSGAEFVGPVDPARCEVVRRGDPSAACRAWLAAQDLRQQVVYVPGSAFWGLQWGEFGVLVALALGSSWFCLWWIRRRSA